MSIDDYKHHSVSSWLTGLGDNETFVFISPEAVSEPLSESSTTNASSPRQSRKRKADDLDEFNKQPPSHPRLSYSALREFDAVMAPGNGGQAQKPLQTPSTTPSKSSSRKERENLNNVSKSLQYHGLYYDEREAWDQRCPEFKDKVLEAFQSDRTSSMASASQKKCSKILEETYYSNEATFHEEMVPAILTNTCIVESKKRDLKGEIIRLAQTWGEVEGLRSQQKPYLAHGFVPGKEATKKALGITEPNPDTVFGKAQIKYVKPGAQAPLDIRVIRALECTVDWPFFIIEAKPVGTGLPAANIQAQRDCGAVIKALLKLKEFVEGPSYKEKIGAIEDFWIFSLCWNPDYAVILVHWAEVTDDKTLLFHATKVGQKFMDTDEGRSALRAYGHNIFDHGLLKHVPNMERLWAKAIKVGTAFDENFDLYD